MITRRGFVVAGFAAGLTSPSVASQARQLLPPIADGFGLRDPADPPPHGEPTVYSKTVTDPAWLISQWNIDKGALSVFAPSDRGAYSAHAVTASLYIDQTSISLAQDGSQLSCSDDHRKPRESDLFFSPSKFKPIALSNLAALELKFDMTMKSAPGARRGTCAISQGGALIGVVLRNGPARETLFYQTHLGSKLLRGTDLVNVDQRALFWYFKANPFGVDDIPSATRPINLLERLNHVLESGPSTMDRDKNNWVISSLYFGQHVWGNITLRSTWKDLQLLATMTPGVR